MKSVKQVVLKFVSVTLNKMLQNEAITVILLLINKNRKNKDLSIKLMTCCVIEAQQPLDHWNF